jgi:hypothetical protein
MNNYFSHDSNARNDEKILALRMKFGMEGYGVYFAILERMRDASEYKCVKDYHVIAFDLRVDTSLVKSVVEDFGLFAFTEGDEYIYSKSFLSRMERKDDVSRAKSEAGKVGASKRWNSKNGKKIAYAMKPDSICLANATKKNSKESKGKESKGKESKGKEREKDFNTPRAERIRFAEFVSMTNDEHSSLVAKLGEDGTARCIEILDNYKGESGKKYESDYRAILNWGVKRYEEERDKAKERGGEGPSRESGNMFFNMLRQEGKL